MAYYMYLSLQEEDRIAVMSMDPSSGELLHLRDVPLEGRPAPLAVDPRRRFLFAGRRLAGDYGLTSFRIDRLDGALSPIGGVSMPGDPVHITTDRTGRFLLSAYYYQEKVAVHPIDGSGALGHPPVEWLDTDIGAHFVQVDRSNRFVLVPHIANGSMTGPNAIFQFKFDAETGNLTPNSPPRVTPQEPDGPRHLCFHPTRDIAYASNEQGCSVTAYNFDPEQGTLEPFQTVPTLPDEFQGTNSCSQIQITPSGRLLYAPNRGHNSIAGFAVDEDTGALTPLGQTPTEPIPRAFSLDPRGNFLYAAGLESGRLASYRVNADSGALEPLKVYPVGQGPMWVLITQF